MRQFVFLCKSAAKENKNTVFGKEEDIQII